MSMEYIEKYIRTKIYLFTKEELIDFGNELYDEDYYDGYFQGYVEDLQDKHNSVCWIGSRYTTSDIDNEETEDVWIYME